ncbi:O-antigen ligase family protein [Ferviditalea candida]|uniref:O-antigen ligase family protein n=1 Tax=Ferviditalea candida TaxID=3108399 RepID=A0ABU5ZE38_9BACL|nr:O-antigen ligase family protein [Paenibacillaceae bacterium T2]
MGVILLLIVYSPFLSLLPMFLVMYYYSRNPLGIYRDNWTNGLFFLFIWSVVVGYLNGQGIYISVSVVILGYMLVHIYLQNHYREAGQVEKLLQSVMLLSLGSAIIEFLELFQVISYAPAWWKYLLGAQVMIENEQYFRYGGTFFNANVAGTWYAVMLLISLYFFHMHQGYRKGLYFLAAATFVLALLITQSRGALIGLMIGLMLYAYFMGHKKKMMLLAFLLISGTALMLFFPEWFPRGNILYSSITDRQIIWENSFRMFLMKPVTGWGIMGIYLADNHIFSYLRVFHAHNILLTMATALGIAGLGVFVWMEWSLLQEFRLLSRNKCRLAPLLVGINGIIMGQGTVDFTIMSPQAGLLFIGAAALTGGLAHAYRRQVNLLPQRIQRLGAVRISGAHASHKYHKS